MTLVFGFFGSSYGSVLDFKDVNLSEASFEGQDWIFQIGAEYLEYPVDFPKFVGDYESIGEEKKSTWGLGLAFGREFKIVGGLSSTILIGGFYNKTVSESVGEAAEDIDLELSTLREDFAIGGGEASISLGYAYQSGTLKIKPFVQFAAGSGNGIVEMEYINRGIDPNDPDDNEAYDVKVSEEFAYAKATLGIEFISSTGYLSYFKLTNTNIAKSSREVVGESKAKGESEEVDLSQDKDEIDETVSSFSGSIGLGVMF